MRMPLRHKIKNLILPRQPSHQSKGSSSTLEVSREDSLSQTIDGSTLIALNSRASLALIEGGRNYGIKNLYDNGNKACVDLVFVHGLIDNAYNTWLDKETRVHWSSKLLGQDISNSRVLSFDYDANVVSLWGRGSTSSSRLFNHVESLVGKLVRERERSDTETRKIIFVAHSLDELITKQALIHFKNSVEKDLNQIECCTTRIVFLRVSHCEVDREAWATIERRMINILMQINKNIVNVLNSNSKMLHNIENNFHIILRQRKNNSIELACFYKKLAIKDIEEILNINFVTHRTINDFFKLCLKSLQRSRATNCITYMQIIW